MHSYLYNGDDIWPKSVNLCTRGRNATLDLVTGPSTSFDLALFGPAWEVHLHSIAATNELVRLKEPLAGTRILAAWPLVTSGLVAYLEAAHDLQSAAARALRSDDPGSSAAKLDIRTLAEKTSFGRFYRYWRLGCRPSSSGRISCTPRKGLPKRPAADRRWSPCTLRLAAEWGRRLKGAVLHRLAFSARKLFSPGEAPDLAAGSLLKPGPRGRELLRRIAKKLATKARSTGLFFDDRRYVRFRTDHLVAEVEGYEPRLSTFQLEAILAQAERQGRDDDPRLEHVRTALARLRFITRAEKMPAEIERDPKRKATLLETRRKYLEMKRHLERDRSRMKKLATSWFESEGQPRLRKHLRRVGDLVLAGSYYFQTEHLDETRSGFTHVAVLAQMGSHEGLSAQPYQFDRVLGFHYAYPVSRLTSSIPVEIVAPDPRIMSMERRYTWVKVDIPQVFRFPNGKSSPVVNLINIIYDTKRRLGRCVRLRVTPGFFYGAVTWMVRHEENAKLLSHAWETKTHRTYGYRTLDWRKLQTLRGKPIYIPVEIRPRSSGR
jgi:hypothetical protein